MEGWPSNVSFGKPAKGSQTHFFKGFDEATYKKTNLNLKN